ncbi:MAG: DUF2283 domain-containing protein [Pseudacidovorax sp.]|uniref:DUF2283 domain-containing protein n=1 Tax=Pseudacidovorax sp. TaxID=1934311 RepID=UPI001B571908|nr:DUF2283 domain-containing protein [Pseudacidovorax sp.]MBP6896598.1 DUF2283 domain-containing protein [Pseudacidovorax sp.]
MKVTYFQDTDTLYIEFRSGQVAETRDLDESTLLEFDDRGRMCAMTIEHASERADIPAFSFEQVAARPVGAQPHQGHP